MGNIIIIAVLLIIVVAAIKSTVKHFKGEGGCCGGGGVSDEPQKVLEGEKLGEIIVKIDGMHCQNCKNSVERQINKIPGASAKVNLRKKIAVISYDRELDCNEIKKSIEKLDFTVKTLERHGD